MSSHASYPHLRKFNLFRILPEKELMTLSQALPTHDIAKGEILDSLEKGVVYFLKEGSAMLQFLTAEGEEATLDILGPGEIFGADSSLASTQYHTYLKVLEPSVICAMSKEDFLDMLERNPQMAYQMVKVYEEKNQRFRERLADMLFKPIDQRLMDELFRLSTQHPAPCSHGGTGEVAIHQQELADIIGASRQAVNAILKSLSQKGLIQVGNGIICLLKPKDLSERK